MSENQEYIGLICANRSYLYQLLQAVIASEPTSELLHEITGSTTRQALELFYDLDVSEVADFVALLNKMAALLVENHESYIAQLADEYTRLFYGPDILPAPPWESIYATGQQVLFSEATLSVRRVYAKHGFLPKGYPNEADDHLAYELDFMFKLASKTEQYMTDNQPAEAKDLIVVQQQFLNKHLLRWVGKFSGRLRESGQQLFYPQYASFLTFFLNTDYKTLIPACAGAMR